MFLFVAWPSKLAKLLIILHDHAYEVKFEQTVIVIENQDKGGSWAHGSNEFCILRRNIIPNTPSNRVHGSSKFGATT